VPEDELAVRRQAKQRLVAAEKPPEADAMTIEDIGWEMALAYLQSQRAVALEEPEVKLEMLWRDVERWTEAYILAVRKRRDET
jgi:hypothetical protein